MKTKLILSALLVVFFSSQVFSQDVTIIQSSTDIDNSQSYSSSKKSKKPRFWIGPKFGTDIVGIPADFDAVGDILKEQWQGGLMMQFGRILYLQPEVYYAQTNNLDAGGEILSSSTAIKVPAMLGLRFLNLGLFSLHIMGGPQWTFPMDNASDQTSETSMDWMLGVGIDVLGFITADIRYKYDVDSNVNDQINNFDIDTTPLNVTIGLKLR
jgi:opacity protein-like surface antigen